MKICKKISGLFLIIFFAATLSAQNNNCNIAKTFPVKKGTALRLSNKYGDVNVITGKEDSLSVCATITIVQENDDLVRMNMKLVTVSIKKSKDTIYISTQYDKKFFSESSRQGRKSFSVDYLIRMPAYLDLSISDEFGNISVEELSGSLNIRLSQGNLSIKKLTKGNVKPMSKIYVDHGKVIIDEINWMTLTLFNCPSVNIGNAQALMMTSSVSKINLGDIGSLISDSKSDNTIIKSINNLISESAYSQYDIGKLNGQIKSKAIYGSINISDLNKSFSTIDIASVQAQITLNPGKDASFRADVTATDAKVEFPAVKYREIIKTESKSLTTLLGLAGINKETKSMIRIRMTSGSLKIQ